MTHKKFGYARVSTSKQSTDQQALELLEYGIPERNIFLDRQASYGFERSQYLILRNDTLRPKDILVVKSINCLGRDCRGIRDEWEHITKTIGADIIVLDAPILDTTHHKGVRDGLITDIVLAVLSFGVQKEIESKSQAQRDGIDAAHQKGVKFGRPRAVPKNWDIWYPKWKAGEITAVKCYKAMRISASTFYRLARKSSSPCE